MLHISSLTSVRFVRPSFARIAGFCLARLIAACGSSGAISLKNPNYFSARVDKDTGVMTGQYNPAGYSTAQVKNVIARICTNKRLASFSEAEQSDLKTYSLTCRGGFAPKWGFVSFERTSRNTVMVESTGSDGLGTVVFTQAEVPLGARGVQSATTPAVAAPASAPSAADTSASQDTGSTTPRCRNSITVYCKDPSSGRIIPKASPGPT